MSKITKQKRKASIEITALYIERSVVACERQRTYIQGRTGQKKKKKLMYRVCIMIENEIKALSSEIFLLFFLV